MEEDIYYLLANHAHKNTMGDVIVKTLQNWTVHLSYSDQGHRLLFYSPEMTPYKFEELDPDTQYEVYSYLQDNKFSLKSQESLVEHSGVEDMSWAIEPQHFTTPCESAENGSLALGAFAVGKELVGENKEMHSVVFISPDKTFATLTCYLAGSPDEVATAKADLRKIAEEMIKFADTL